jgi:hypothetical protein
MAQVARDAGLSRELVQGASSERSPGFDTILKVMAALDRKLHAEADGADHREPLRRPEGGVPADLRASARRESPEPANGGLGNSGQTPALAPPPDPG